MARKLLTLAILSVLLVAAAQPRAFSIAGKKFRESEIVDARALPDTNGTAGILVTLDEKAARKLRKISRRYRDKPVTVSLDGQTLVSPVMRSEILDGVMQISGLFPIARAEELAKRISGKEPLPETLEDLP